MAKADKNSWKIFPMPEKNSILDFKAEFTAQEFDKISRGFIPQAMEQKWFIYMEENTLYFHRSWTGHCIYRVDFVMENDKHVVSRAVVNRDPDQYTVTYDGDDIEILEYLIDKLR